jgi:hypothetical protein
MPPGKAAPPELQAIVEDRRHRWGGGRDVKHLPCPGEAPRPSPYDSLIGSFQTSSHARPVGSLPVDAPTSGASSKDRLRLPHVNRDEPTRCLVNQLSNAAHYTLGSA